MIGRRYRPGIVGIALTCSALLAAACGSTGASTDANQTTAPHGSDVALVDLGAPGEVAAWTTVNDPVMGGMSTARITFGDDGLVFSGNLSLANNGGFASVRSPLDPDIGRKAKGTKALRVRALGDGKTYLLKVSPAGQPWSYVQRFRTESGVQKAYDLPVEDFEPVGMRLDPAPDAPQNLDPSTLSQVALYILDKQQGPFSISVDGIDAVF